MSTRTTATFQGCYHNAQDAELSHEARHALRTTRFDLAAFLALPSEVRAARWRQWGAEGAEGLATKREVVTLQLISKYGFWDDELVDLGVATFDAKWGATPTGEETGLTEALELLADEAAHQAQHGPVEQRRQAAAEQRHITRAAEQLRAGRSAQEVGPDTWSVPSKTGSGHYLVRRAQEAGREVWRCSCPRGTTGCWHRAAARAAALSATPSQILHVSLPLISTPAPAHLQVALEGCRAALAARAVRHAQGAPAEPVVLRLARIRSQVWSRAFELAA